METIELVKAVCHFLYFITGYFVVTEICVWELRYSIAFFIQQSGCLSMLKEFLLLLKGGTPAHFYTSEENYYAIGMRSIISGQK